MAMMCRALLAARSPPRLRRWRVVLPDDAGTGLTPHSAAKPASDRRRCGLSPAVRAAVLQLLQAGEVDPRLIILAVAQVVGELGAATALASGRREAEDLVDELAEVVRQSGRDHHQALKIALLPAAGNA